MRRLLFSLLALALLAGCPSGTRIPDEDRARVERELPGRTVYLRHSMYVTPFWNDRHKVFLTDIVPDERPWVVDPAGEPVYPAHPFRIVPAGTRARIVRVELPTSMALATRTPLSPRHYPWVLLEVEGLPAEPTPTLVLRDDLATFDQLAEELTRYLSPDDLAGALAALPEEVRLAVAEKRLVEGMTADAVAMAWGYPERKSLDPTPQGRREEWLWGGGKRRAVILDGRLQPGWKGEGAKLEPRGP